MTQKLIKFTDTQDAALTAILAATGETLADCVRRLLQTEAAQHGIEFPQDMPPARDLSKVRSKRWKK